MLFGGEFISDITASYSRPTLGLILLMKTISAAVAAVLLGGLLALVAQISIVLATVTALLLGDPLALVHGDLSWGQTYLWGLCMEHGPLPVALLITSILAMAWSHYLEQQPERRFLHLPRHRIEDDPCSND
jgi:hypothetical protein